MKQRRPEPKLVQITVPPLPDDLRLRRLLCGKAPPFCGVSTFSKRTIENLCPRPLGGEGGPQPPLSSGGGGPGDGVKKLARSPSQVNQRPPVVTTRCSAPSRQTTQALPARFRSRSAPSRISALAPKGARVGTSPSIVPPGQRCRLPSAFSPKCSQWCSIASRVRPLVSGTKM